MNKWDSIIQKCKNEIKDDFFRITNEEISIEEVKKSFPTANLPKKSKNYVNIDAINAFMNAKDIKQREKVYINNLFNHKSYLANLFSVYVNLEFGNLSGASLYLKKLINIPVHFLALEMDEINDSVKKTNTKENVLKIFIKIWDSEINEHLKNLYFDGLNALEESEIKDMQTGFLGEFLKTKTSFSIDDYRFSISFPSLWFKKIGEEEKIKSFLHKYFNSPAFIDIMISEYGIFSVTSPVDKQKIDFLLEKLSPNWQDYEYYEQEAILESLENPVFRKDFQNKFKNLNIPLYNLKKNLYKENFEIGRFRVYSILKLFELGHEDEVMLGHIL